jgi:DNA-binding IclR family transcriptional regulator
MADDPARDTPRYSAPAAACAAELLLVLARSESTLTLAELSARTGSSKSLVFRVLAELEARDYVSRLLDGTYSLGLAVIELGGAFSASVPLMASVRRVLRRVADQTGETVSLGVLQGAEVLYLMREEGTRSVFAVSHVGKRLPANAVALGKALLARKSDAEVRAVLARASRLEALTPSTITSLESLLEDLAMTRARGHAEEHGEAVSGRCCVAVSAAFHQQGIDRVAISISMDEARFVAGRDTVIRALLAAGDQVTREARGRASIGEPPAPSQLVTGDFT